VLVEHPRVPVAQVVRNLREGQPEVTLKSGRVWSREAVEPWPQATGRETT
jgi:hypothetical protein